MKASRCSLCRSFRRTSTRLRGLRPFCQGHVIDIGVARALPVSVKRVVDDTEAFDGSEPGRLEIGIELVGSDETLPMVGAPRQPAQDVFRSYNGQGKGLERAVDGGDEHESPGPKH